MFATLLALALSPAAHAGDFTRTEIGDSVAIEMAWEDRKDRPREVAMLLPADRVAAAEDTAPRAPAAAAAKAAGRRVEAAFANRADVVVNVRVGRRGGMRYEVEAANRGLAAAALAEAQELGGEAFAQELRARGYRMLEGDVMAPDYAAAVEAAAPHLKDLAKSLGPRKDRRAYTNQALAFVQAIPYEGNAVTADTWRPPLAVLAGNRGDCDSKVTLFLAIMRAAYPKMDLAAVLVPGHAMAAVDIGAGEKDAVVGKGKRRLVVAEAVGPELSRVGWVEGKSKRGLKSRKRRVLRMPGA
jgi:hypothetical protein